MRGKGRGNASQKDAAPDVSYTRCALLQLNPHFMAVSGSKSRKEPPSPGSLHCVSMDKLGESAPSRPRAASDSAHPAVRHKATTVVLHNIPTEYSRTGLCEELAAQGFGYAIDFLYLPINGSTGLNEGHALVNVRSKDAYRDFKQAFDGVPAKTCLPAYQSQEVCKVATAEVQGRDANRQKLCTASNLKKWNNHDDWQPLFLDDYGCKMLLVQSNGDENGGYKQRERSTSEYKASPVLKPQKSPPTKASPSLRPEAKEFSPSTAPKTKVEPATVKSSPPLRADAAVFSPSLRADANEFVPAEALAEPMLLPEPMSLAEPAFVD